jgi:hypothetical protein
MEKEEKKRTKRQMVDGNKKKLQEELKGRYRKCI